MKFFKITLFFLFGFVTNSYAQDFPKNPEVGKCYEKCFYYDKKFEWLEVDCEKVKSKKNHVQTKKDSIKIKQNKLKMIAYQKKLIKLKYDCEASGELHDSFIKAHHKYLRDKEKAARKARRKKKRQE